MVRPQAGYGLTLGCQLCKDREAAQYLARAIRSQGLNEEDVLKHIWSYNPYWTRKGYEEYAMPSVAWTLLPQGSHLES